MQRSPTRLLGLLLALSALPAPARADDVDWDFDDHEQQRREKGVVPAPPAVDPEPAPAPPAPPRKVDPPTPVPPPPSPVPAPAPPPPAPPLPTPAPSPVADREPASFAGTVDAHNRVRAAVGVPPLAWSNKVAEVAQNWADGLKATRGCDMKHSSNSYGENLFWGSGKRWTMSEAVASWAEEKADYTYASNSCRSGGVCGHYTQVVWKKSTVVGCGMAFCGSAMVVVCNYDPPGNYVGQKPY